MRQIIATLATEALQQDGCIAHEGAIAVLNFLATLSPTEASDSSLPEEHGCLETITRNRNYRY